MKTRLPTLLRFLAFCAAAAPAAAQQSDAVSRTINEVFKIDERGDADVEVSFTYGASQWAVWKEDYGNRPDIVLRDMRYSMATAVLDHFSLEKDDVQRKALGKVRARAVARYRSGGEFIIEIPKVMNLVTGANSEWIFSATTGRNGEMVTTTEDLKLPASAKNVHLTPAGDFNDLGYTLDVTPVRPKGWLEAGIAMLSTGAGLFLVSLFANRKKVEIITPSPRTTPRPPPSLPPS